ncbi:MAG: recombinase RecT [Thermoanaerobaculia bacterium]
MSLVKFDDRGLGEQLTLVAPQLTQALAGRLGAERLIRTMLVSVERNPQLLDCTRQSLLQAAMTAAVLGLEVDGVTGQGYLIPFRDNKAGTSIAQFVIGYKGFNTIAARAGFVILGDVFRDGDRIEYDIANGYVSHSPVLGNKGKILGAWARAMSRTLPPVAVVMGIDEILAVKRRSPGAKRSDSPWNDVGIGFPAMASKTPKRRLARSMPLNTMQLAAALEEAVEERGMTAHIRQDGVLEAEVIRDDSDADPLASMPADLADRARKFLRYITASTSTKMIDARWGRKESLELRGRIAAASKLAADHIVDAYDKRRTVLAELEEL